MDFVSVDGGMTPIQNKLQAEFALQADNAKISGAANVVSPPGLLSAPKLPEGRI